MRIYHSLQGQALSVVFGGAVAQCETAAHVLNVLNPLLPAAHAQTGANTGRYTLTATAAQRSVTSPAAPVVTTQAMTTAGMALSTTVGGPGRVFSWAWQSGDYLVQGRFETAGYRTDAITITPPDDQNQSRALASHTMTVYDGYQSGQTAALY